MYYRKKILFTYFVLCMKNLENPDSQRYVGANATRFCNSTFSNLKMFFNYSDSEIRKSRFFWFKAGSLNIINNCEYFIRIKFKRQMHSQLIIRAKIIYHDMTQVHLLHYYNHISERCTCASCGTEGTIIQSSIGSSELTCTILPK